MDRDKRQQVERHLDEAERHVAEGERLLESERRNVEERLRDDHPVTLAMELLTTMEETQRLHREDRDRLRREFADKPPTSD